MYCRPLNNLHPAACLSYLSTSEGASINHRGTSVSIVISYSYLSSLLYSFLFVVSVFCCSSVFLWTSNAGSREKKKKKNLSTYEHSSLRSFFFLFLRRQRERERERVRKCEKERERERDTKRSVIEVISYYQYYRIIRLMLSLLFYYYYDYYY